MNTTPKTPEEREREQAERESREQHACAQRVACINLANRLVETADELIVAFARVGGEEALGAALAYNRLTNTLTEMARELPKRLGVK